MQAEASHAIPIVANKHGAPARQWLNEHVTRHLLEAVKKIGVEQYVVVSYYYYFYYLCDISMIYVLFVIVLCLCLGRAMLGYLRFEIRSHLLIGWFYFV